MKTVNFKTIKIKNFLSIGNDPVEVSFQSGIRIITGINKDKQDRRNGVGKSAIADAIHFAVFGTSIREIKKENIVNKINKKNCYVELCFDIVENNTTKEFRIARTLRPSKCWVYVDGEDRTRDSISNTNQFIQKYLKTTPDIFQNCVIMTINGTTPFLAKSKGEKRKFIESIFNLKVFSNMADLLKTEQSEFKRQSELEFTKSENLQVSLSTQKKQKSEYENEKRTRVARLNIRISDNSKEIKNLQEKLNNIKVDNKEQLEDKLSKLEDAIDKTENKLNEIAENNATLQGRKNNLNDSLDKVIDGGAVCDHCLRPMDDGDHDHLTAEKDKIKNNITTINTDIEQVIENKEQYVQLKDKLKVGFNDINIDINNISIKQKERENYIERIEKLNYDNKELEEDKKDTSSLSKQFLDEIKKLEVEVSDAKKEVDRIKKQINLMDIVKFVLSEEGVRAYIVKKILQMFNGRLAYYLKRMDANCICLFNEYFEEEIFDEKGRDCSYFNFSGAERKNLDLACLFTFMDIRRLQGDIAYNVSVYDELLDSSLDERGVEMVIDILRERVEKFDESVMIISHRKESVKAAGDSTNESTNDIIFLEKENGITRRVEYTE